MDLSRNIIKRYVQVASPEKITSNSETVYGTVVNEGEKLYVKIDGSNILTPVSSTIDIKANDRVLVLVKNHEATVIGSPSSPTARLDELNKLGTEVTEFKAVATNDLISVNANIKNLNTDYGNFKTATADNFTAVNANIKNLNTDYGKFKTATADNFTAVNASITNLNTTYAKIDFANIEQAAVKKIFSESGIIKDLIVSEGKITGELVGVTIKGDLIEGNTIQADKLVVKGSDGLYYKLNIEGGATTSEQVSDEDLQN